MSRCLGIRLCERVSGDETVQVSVWVWVSRDETVIFSLRPAKEGRTPETEAPEGR